MFFTQLSAKVFGAIGITFLGIYTTKYVTGIYSALYKIPYLLVLVWSPISQIIYPITSKRITAEYTNGVDFIRKIEKYCLLVFGFLALVIALLAKIVSPIFGQEYGNYYYIIYPLLAWVLLGIHNNFLGIQILVGSGHDKEYGIVFEIGVVITILLNYILIKRIGLMGAATAPAISELILSILLYFQEKKVENKIG